MQHALLMFGLEQAIADAAPLTDGAAKLLAAQIAPDTDTDTGVSGELPDFDAVCAALRVPRERTAVQGDDDSRLPRRVAAGRASELERSIWRSWYEAGVHEVLTVQMVNALVARVRAALGTGAECAPAGPQAAEMEPETDAGTEATACDLDLPVVLECGAGSGALAAQLAARLRGEARVVAVDDSSSRIRAVAPVQELDCAVALAKYKPRVVLAAWMPSGLDWTEAMRACASVREYILLGEADGAACGDLWATWGVLPAVGCARCGGEGCERCDTGLDEDSVAPHVEEGFARAELGAVQRYQLCRFDSAAARGFSSAVAFTRM